MSATTVQSRFDSATFRRALGHVPTSVCVVTTSDHDGSTGMTVGSFTSISLAPPLVGFFADSGSATLQRVRNAGHFTVNLLDDAHGELCRAFARTSGDRFADVPLVPGPHAAPRIAGALGWVDCTVDSMVSIGDHDLVVGQVLELEVPPRAEAATGVLPRHPVPARRAHRAEQGELATRPLRRMVTARDSAEPPGSWVLTLVGAGDHPPASRPPLVAQALESLGPGPLSWAVDLGQDMATAIIAETPAFSGGEEAFQTLRMGTESSTLSGMLLLVAGDAATVGASQEALDGDRDFVRRGILIDLVLGGIRIGHSMMSRSLLEAAAGAVAEPLRAAEMQRTSELLFEYIDSFASNMATEYLSEHDRWVTSAAAERAELVNAILDGQAVSADQASATLGYPINRHHVAFVVWREPGTTATPSDLQRSASRLLAGSGCSKILLIPNGASSVWVWAAWRSCPTAPPPLTLPAEPGTQVAVGTVASGVCGFRQSHHEAGKTAELVRSVVAGGSPTRSAATWYADVELAVMLSQDLELARTFVSRELSSLATDCAAAAELRETLAVYLTCERSLAKAAEILHVARNTVAYRVKKIENTTGRDLRQRRLELETALRLAQVLGPQVLTRPA